MADDDAAALARSFGACCLRALKEISEQTDDPEMAAIAWRDLQHALVRLRRFAADPWNPDDARQDALATLRGFLDS
jgi:hypothetical protein